MKKLIGLNIVFTFLIFVWGSIVRTHGAGLACPDWPLCHGKLIPPFELPILLEWTHRLLGALVGFLTVGIVVSAWLNSYLRRNIGLLSVGAIILLVIQVLLGALTVKGLLKPEYVAVHVAVAFLFLATMLSMFLKLNDARYEFHGRLLARKNLLFMLSGIVTFAVYVQIILGAGVSSSHSGLACPDFPLCLGQWIPPLTGHVVIHLLHRLMALGVLLSIGILFVTSCQISWDSKFRESIGVVFLIALLQFGVGVSNIFFRIPIPLSVLHMGLATLLFILSFTMMYKVQSS